MFNEGFTSYATNDFDESWSLQRTSRRISAIDIVLIVITAKIAEVAETKSNSSVFSACSAVKSNLVLWTLFKDLRNFLNCIPTACRGSYTEELLDLAEIADRLHLPAIQTEDESAFDRNDLHQPVTVRG